MKPKKINRYTIFHDEQMGFGRRGSMIRVKLALVFLITGVFTLIISATADFTGLGTFDGFGPNQLLAVTLGAILLVIGIILLISHNRRSA